MAYIDGNGNVGYYSTVTIAKFTYYPTVSIVGFNRQMTNTDNTTYTGVYHNLQDPTEKCYQYKFTLMDEKSNIIDIIFPITSNFPSIPLIFKNCFPQSNTSIYLSTIFRPACSIRLLLES